MKNERILDALSRADDRYVEEAMPTAAHADELKGNAFEAEGVKAEPVVVAAPKRKVYASRIAAAACACVAVGGLVVWGAVGGLGSLSENPTTADTSEEYAQTGSPELNGYHNFMLTQEQLYDSVWSCYIPEYFPAGYSLLDNVHCVTANGVAPANYEAELFLWLSNGITDPDTAGYNPIGFSLVVDNHLEGYADPDYDLQTLTVGDVAEMGQVGTIDCGHNVWITVTRTYPELVPDEEIYKMIMSMPYAHQYAGNTYFNVYLTRDEVYSSHFADYIPTVLPAGYSIAGLSPYFQTEYSFNGNSGGRSISLYISNGVEDPSLFNYCPIRYTVQTYPDNPDTSDKPLYQSIWDLTVEDVAAAVQSGGFYTTYMGIELIEVSFPRAERVNVQEIYDMVMSAPCAVNPDANKLPEPFGERNDTTVEYYHDFYFPYIFELGLLHGGIYDLRDRDDVSRWIDSLPSIDDLIYTAIPTDLNSNMNQYSFITHFNISKAEAEPVYSANFGDNGWLTEEQFELLFSGDIAKINKGFANEYAIVKGEHAYSPNWLYTHSHEDYRAAGISPDDIKEKMGLYYEIGLTPQAEKEFISKLTTYGTENADTYTPKLYISKEELYTNMWTMYVPRELPEGYVLDGSYWGWAVFEPSEFPNGGTIYIKLTDDNNPISYTIYADSLKYDTLGEGAEFFTRYSGIDKVHLLKEYGWIDFENATVKVKVEIADPDAISDEELYRFVMSVPAFRNLVASKLDTAALDSQIYTDLPVVKFDSYYDVERYTLDGEVFEKGNNIIGFDGTYAYFHDQPHENGNGQQIYRVGWYNVKTGETGFLPEDGYTGRLGYIYSDGEYVYCSKQKLTDEEEYEYKVVRYNVESGREEIILELGNALLMGDVTVNGNYMFMYVYYLDSSEYKLVSYYMNSGVFGTKAKSVSDLPREAFNYIDVDDISYAVTLPYEYGVIYIMPANNAPDFIAPTCFMFFWDGVNDPIPLFEARLDSIYDGEKGEQLCFSDGETVYFVRETYANGTDASAGMHDTLSAFDLTDAFVEFDSPMEHMLANNKNPTNSPFHEWHGTGAVCGGGMVAIDPYSGLIYDAENGWFTHVNKNVYYRVVLNDSSFDGIAMLEYADVEYDPNADFVDYPEGGNDLTLCIITRK